MNVRVLRKWCLMRTLMYLWIVACTLFLVVWCEGAAAMHLPPPLSASNSTSHHRWAPLVTGSTAHHQRHRADHNHHLDSLQRDVHGEILLQRLLAAARRSPNIPIHQTTYQRPRLKQQHITDLRQQQQHQSPISYLSAPPFGRNRRESRFRPKRGRQRRYCSTRDPTALAHEAPTVFEGKVRSMSSDRRVNFSVTFEVKQIYKNTDGFKLPSLVRLQFSFVNSSDCDIFREIYRPRGSVTDELEQGKVYFLFVKQVDLGNFSILGQPIKKTKKTLNEVKTGASEKYGQSATIEFLTESRRVYEGRKVRLVCRVKGQPPPKISWYKDDVPIKRNRTRYTFSHFKRRSVFVIESVAKSDMGKYECRAKNSRREKPYARTTYLSVEDPPTTTTIKNFFSLNATKSDWDPCPMNGDVYCLNGGSCLYFPEVKEAACQCPEGFVGVRCQTKNPTNPQTSTYNQCGNQYHGGYYC
ncbi:Protein vein [Sergentomyia squamirostris]